MLYYVVMERKPETIRRHVGHSSRVSLKLSARKLYFKVLASCRRLCRRSRRFYCAITTERTSCRRVPVLTEVSRAELVLAWRTHAVRQDGDGAKPLNDDQDIMQMIDFAIVA